MSKTIKATQALKKLGGLVKKPFSWAWHHKKKTALILGAGAASVGAAMYAGYIPTPEIVQSAVAVAETTVLEHPTESLIAGSAVGGIVGYAALKKGAKGAKKIYILSKNAGTLAAAKASGLFGKKTPAGGAPASQVAQGQVASIDWERAKFFVPET